MTLGADVELSSGVQCGIFEVSRDRRNRTGSEMAGGLNLCLAFGLLFGLQETSQASDQPPLSAAQSTVVNRKIAALKSPADRHVAQGWSHAKKVAELLCRPAALPVLRKQAADVDRVFLGTDAANSLNLESNRRLTGTGQFRNPEGWRDFAFTCELDPTTGRVISFEPRLPAPTSARD
jgi:hypothetical protein